MARSVRALLRYGIERFERAGLSYGHGTSNALDESAWIILHALGYPPHDLESHLVTPLSVAQALKSANLALNPTTTG